MNDDTGFRRMSEALAIAVRRAEKAERERDEALKRVRDRDEVIGNLHVALREAELGEAKSDLNATRVLRERDEARREAERIRDRYGGVETLPWEREGDNE